MEKQANSESYSSLAHVEPRNLPRSPDLGPRCSGSFDRLLTLFSQGGDYFYPRDSISNDNTRGGTELGKYVQKEKIQTICPQSELKYFLNSLVTTSCSQFCFSIFKLL